MHRDELRTPRIGWALIFLLSALPLLYGPAWAKTGPAALRIETVDHVHLGGTAEVAVVCEVDGSPFTFAGFSVLIAYDSAYGSLISVAPADRLIDDDWEYFSYETWSDSAASTPGGSRFIRITARAGEGQPTPLQSGGSGELARLTFALNGNAPVPSTARGPRLATDGHQVNVIFTPANDTIAVAAEDSENKNAADTWNASARIITPPYLQPGDTGTIRVVLDGLAPGFETGGFNLFLEYDSSAMTILSVEQGQVLTDCGWERFSWRRGTTYDCAEAPCRKPLINIFALADDFTPGDPLCWALSKGELARIRVVMSSDPASVASAYPIEWVWYDCSDNEWASKNGDSLYISRTVFDHDATDLTAEAEFPSVTGAPSTCLTSDRVTRSIDYRHGLIDIISADSLDNRGDVNYNGAAYEVADWVLFANCFIYGPGILTANPAAQTSATDVNADNIPLTLDDLIYLMRIITGDAQPYPRVPASNDTLVIEQDVAAGTVSFAWPGPVRGLFLKFDDSAAVDISHRFGGAGTAVLDDSTRVLITPSLDSMESFLAGEVLTYSGDVNLVYAEASYDGQVAIPVVIKLAAGPVKVQIAPETYSAAQTGSTEPIPALLYIGNMTGCTPAEIDPATIRINGTVPALSSAVVPPPPGFSGDVLAANFDARGLMDPLFPCWGTDTASFSVSWLAAPDCPQGGSGSIILIGYQLGDVNADGTINVSDLTLLVAYFFRDGASQVSREAADINGSGSANVSDLVALVKILFH